MRPAPFNLIKGGFMDRKIFKKVNFYIDTINFDVYESVYCEDYVGEDIVSFFYNGELVESWDVDVSKRIEDDNIIKDIVKTVVSYIGDFNEKDFENYYKKPKKFWFFRGIGKVVAWTPVLRYKEGEWYIIRGEEYEKWQKGGIKGYQIKITVSLLLKGDVDKEIWDYIVKG